MHPSAGFAPTSSFPSDSLQGTITAPDQFGELSELVQQATGQEPAAESVFDPGADEGSLVGARLGIAAGLYRALRCKDAATAAHALRVSLGCSAWAQAAGLPAETRERLEIAAILHDIGKIGVPDSILTKPEPLKPDEQAIMNRHRSMGLDVVSASCRDQDLIDIVRYSPAWFDGSRQGFALSGLDLPLAARMLSIMDAFDAMTSDHVYRRALPLERAVHELFEFAGTQFDPELVRSFAELRLGSQGLWYHRTATQWLRELDADQVDSLWQRGTTLACAGQMVPEALFQQRLLDHLSDGVVFVDRGLQIVLWNRGAERLTGISSESAFQRPWQPRLVDMRTVDGLELEDADCPVRRAIAGRTRSHLRLSIRSRGGGRVMVDMHVVAVVGPDGTTHGATVTLHDASGEASLEERCQNLHELATRDPLTQVANRAEFDRVHELFVAAHLQHNLPCSLIICDIDHFKSINDNYGHPVGDEAIKGFAELLRRACRAGDLVARYGGEEFVVLCADCGNATAASRAEQIRASLAGTTHHFLGGRSFTASFGVTEIQPGDSAETMLNRADRALLDAKRSGRNTVVQLGTGISGWREEPKRRWWQWTRRQPDRLITRQLLTKVPLKVAVEKLRGFLADHQAEIEALEEGLLKLKLDGNQSDWLRRSPDQPLPLQIELAFVEERTGEGNAVQTRVDVVMRPLKHRDRRRGDALQRARQVLASLKAYLMACEVSASVELTKPRLTTNLLLPWRSKRETA